METGNAILLVGVAWTLWRLLDTVLEAIYRQREDTRREEKQTWGREEHAIYLKRQQERE